MARCRDKRSLRRRAGRARNRAFPRLSCPEVREAGSPSSSRVTATLWRVFCRILGSFAGPESVLPPTPA